MCNQIETIVTGSVDWESGVLPYLCTRFSSRRVILNFAKRSGQVSAIPVEAVKACNS